MAIEKVGSGAYQDYFKIKGSGTTQSIAAFVQDIDAGGTDAIEEIYQGANQGMVLTSGGNVVSITEFVKYAELGGTDTITGQLIGAGSNVIVDGGVMKNLVEKQSGNIQVLEEGPEISLLETDEPSGDLSGGEDPEASDEPE